MPLKVLFGTNFVKQIQHEYFGSFKIVLHIYIFFFQICLTFYRASFLW